AQSVGARCFLGPQRAQRAEARFARRIFLVYRPVLRPLPGRQPRQGRDFKRQQPSRLPLRAVRGNAGDRSRAHSGIQKVNSMHFIAASTGPFESLRAHLSSLSPLVWFVVGMSAIFIMPSLSRRVKLPSVVGLLVAGIILGPHVLDIFGKARPVAVFVLMLTTSILGPVLTQRFAPSMLPGKEAKRAA